MHPEAQKYFLVVYSTMCLSICMFSNTTTLSCFLSLSYNLHVRAVYTYDSSMATLNVYYSPAQRSSLTVEAITAFILYQLCTICTNVTVLLQLDTDMTKTFFFSINVHDVKNLEPLMKVVFDIYLLVKLGCIAILYIPLVLHFDCVVFVN